MRYIIDFWAAAKQPRLDIDEAVDDVLPLAIAQKFRERLVEQQRSYCLPSDFQEGKGYKGGY